MKTLLAGSIALGLMAAPALAGSGVNVTNTPVPGSKGSSFSGGGLHGFHYNFAPGGGVATPPHNRYDNWPTVLGGTATPQFFGPFNDIPGTFLFIDWAGEATIGSDRQLGDYAQLASPGGSIGTIQYGYSGPSGVAVTHIVKIYDAPSAPSPGVSSPAIKGATLASIVLPAQPSGTNTVLLNLATPIAVPGSAVWVKLEETGDPTFGTFWLTGGRPGVGSTVDGATFSTKGYYYGGNYYPPYNTHVGGLPYFYFTGSGYVQLNPSIGLSIPAPATAALLGLAGLVSLRRRRR